MNIGRTEIVALARDVYEGNDFKGTLARSKKPFVKKLENKLWGNLKERYPDRDFTCGDESLTRANIVKKLERILKCKSYISCYIRS